MHDEFLLNERDMRKDTHFPVIAFLGVISNKSRFLPIIDHLSNGIGYGFNYATCLFPDDTDTEPERFEDGVEFALDNGEAVVINYEEFYWYLNEACKHYLEKYPVDADAVRTVLDKTKARFHITELL